MDIDSNLSNNQNQQQQQQQNNQHQQQQQKQLKQMQLETQQQQKQPQDKQQLNTSNNQNNIKANPTFDWLTNFPISEAMKSKTQLETDFSRKIFNLLKQHLHDFYPGKEIKPKTDNRKALKSSFYHIIRIMTESRPEFLVEFI